MKVLYIGRYNTSEELSGPEKVAKRIFAESSKQNETVFVEYFFDGTIYGVMKKLFGCQKEGDSKIYRLGLFRILPFLFRFRPQIIHIITFERFAVIVYLYKIFFNVKIIYNVHGVAVYENKNLKNVSSPLKSKDAFSEKILMKFSDTLLFLSEIQLNHAKKYYNPKKTKVQFINNGVDEQFQFKNKHTKKNKFPSLVFIGDSERKDKNFNFLYSILNSIEYKCTLYILGSFNPLRFNTLIGNVTIIPVNRMDRDSLAKFLSDKDVFVSPSSYDTFSIAAAECMSLGLVPVVTNTTGISKLIIEGKNGFVVKHGDETALTEKINLLLKDAGLKTEMSKKSSEIYNELNWNKVFKSYQNIYNSFL